MTVKDKYKLVLSGDLEKNVDKETAVKNLSGTLNIQAKSLMHYFDGKKRTVKGTFDLNKAKKINSIFRSQGAVSKIELVLDKKILDSATIFIKKKKPETCRQADTPDNSVPDPIAAGIKSPEYSFDRYSFSPLIFSPPQMEQINDSDGKSKGSIETLRPVIGWVLILFAAIILANIIQRSALHLLVHITGTGGQTTVIGIIIFFLCLLYLPKLLRPGKNIIVKGVFKDTDKITCKCKELRSGTAFTRSFAVMDNNSSQIAIIKRNLFFSNYTCNISGRVFFSVDNEEDIDEAALSLGETVYEWFLDLISLVKMALSKVYPILKPEKKKQKIYENKIIRNAEGSVVAIFKCPKPSILEKNNICTLKIVEEDSSSHDNPVLLALALVLAGI